MNKYDKALKANNAEDSAVFSIMNPAAGNHNSV